jgi:Transposase, Mutator family
MPVSRQKKCTTPNTPDSTEGQSAPALPTPQQFQQHLRELARGAIRIVLEDVMREERDALIGVGWGESSPKRKGYRNGSYTREPPHDHRPNRGVAHSPRSRGPVPHPGLRALPTLRAASRRWAHGDVRGRGKHPQGGGSGPNLDGSGPQRQCHQSPQPASRAAIQRLARAPVARALAHPVPGWHPFQRASWRSGRLDRDPDRDFE